MKVSVVYCTYVNVHISVIKVFKPRAGLGYKEMVWTISNLKQLRIPLRN